MSDKNISSALSSASSQPRSRRSLLKGAVAGAAGVTVAGAAGAYFFTSKGTAVHASGGNPPDSIASILSIAATAEELAVTFYTQGIHHAGQLGISGANLDYLLAAVIEEQIHRDFLVAAGGKPLTNTFSFPYSGHTFEQLDKFINTLQQLEEAFIAAYLAAVSEFSQYGQPRLAQIAAQIMGVEAEHRALGRSISPNFPFANNFAFEPALVDSVHDAASYLANNGYLSPRDGNSYKYEPVSTDNSNVVYRTPYLAN